MGAHLAGGARHEVRSMTADPADWHRVLARVTGELVRGEQRGTTRELITVHLNVRETDRNYRHLRNIMRELGWRRPKLMRWGDRSLSGYWPHPILSARHACPPEEQPDLALLGPTGSGRG